MADVNVYIGGTPDIRFPYCDRQRLFQPPHGLKNASEIEDAYPDGVLYPPFNAHCDGAYAVGYFTLGMSISFNGESIDPVRGKVIRDANVGVGDIMRMIVIPADHFCPFVNFKIENDDPRMAGATVGLTVERISYNATTNAWEYEELTDIEDAMTAQGVSNIISTATTSSTFVSTLNVESGYAVPLYSGGTSGWKDSTLVLGVKLLSVPTNTAFAFTDALNGWYMSAKVHGFESPAYVG